MMVEDPRVPIDPDHLRRTRNVLAEQGVELTLEDAHDAIDGVCVKIGELMGGVDKHTVRRLMDKAAALRALARVSLLEILEEFKQVDEVLLIEAAAEAYKPVGMGKEDAKKALDRLCEEGLLLRIGEDVMIQNQGE